MRTLLVALALAGAADAFAPLVPASRAAARLAPQGVLRMSEYPDDYEPDIVEKLFGFFFGEKEKEPLGLKRVTRDSAPETWKATKTEFAEPLSSDRGEAALIRPLLARTNIEKRALKVTYDARKDGWTPRAFHRGVDFKGPSVVVAKTKGGAIVGGYNPKGWAGYGESRNSIAAFLFRINPGGDARSAAKLPKVGSAGLSVIDEEEKGPRFGPDGLVIELAKGSERTAISRLGNAYERLPDGSKSLFIDEGGISAELVDLKVLSGVYEKDEIVPYSGALPGQLG